MNTWLQGEHNRLRRPEQQLLAVGETAKGALRSRSLLAVRETARWQAQENICALLPAPCTGQPARPLTLNKLGLVLGAPLF